jgi:hypothetical protein
MRTLLVSILALLIFALPVMAEKTEDIGAPEPNAAAFVPGPVFDWTGRDVLYDNGPVFNSTYGGYPISVLQSALLMTTYGFGHAIVNGYRMADDFVVPVGQTWNITAIVFDGYQTGSTTVSTFTDYRVQIWNGPPNAGGSVIWGDLTTNRLSGTVWAGGYRVLDTAPSGTTRPIMANTCAVTVTLTAGTYWLDWMAAGTLASGPWCPPITITGVTTTGNGLQYTTAWAPANDTGSVTQQGLPFVIQGTLPSAVAEKSWTAIKSLYR